MSTIQTSQNGRENLQNSLIAPTTVDVAIGTPVTLAVGQILNGTTLGLSASPAGAATEVVNLPSVATFPEDATLEIVTKDLQGNTLDITPNGTETINGVAAAVSLATNYQILQLKADPANSGWVLA